MANKTFNAGDVLPASDLNANMVQPGLTATGTRIVAGITAGSFTAQANVQLTINYGYTFSAPPKVVATVHIGSNLRAAVGWNNAPGVSSADANVFQAQGSSISGAFNVHWIAIGPP